MSELLSIEHLHDIIQKLYALQKDVEVERQRVTLLYEFSETHRALQKEALDKAETGLTIRLQGMNEFRQQLNNQATTFATREMMETLRTSTDTAFKAITTQLSDLIYRETFETWKKENDTWKSTVAPIADVKLIDKNVDDLKTALNKFQGIIGFLQFAGAAGLIALLMSILRLAGVVR